MIHVSSQLKVILFDWGDTLMSEDGPPDYTMADWPVVRALDGASEVLAALAERYRIAIATNATISKRPDIERALQRVGMAAFVGEIFCFTELGCRKDSLAFWHIVLARLQVNTTDVVMIGDSLEQDVLGPQRAGIAAIWFNWKAQPVPAECKVPVIRGLAELPPLIDELSGRNTPPQGG